MAGLAEAVPRVEPELVIAEYNALLRNLIIIQGLFAGLALGKMSEGVLIAGIKHSLIMIFLGISLFLLFI